MSITKIFAKDKSGKTASLDLSEALKANASFKIVTEIPDPPEANVIYVQVESLDSSTTQAIQQLFLSDKEGEEAYADLENQTLFIPDATDSQKGILTLTTVKTTANASITELLGIEDFSGEVFE